MSFQISFQELTAESHDIYLLDPLNLLLERQKFMKSYNSQSYDPDLFSVYYQIIIRGGIEEVTKRNQWITIQQSIVYQNLSIEQIQQMGNQVLTPKTTPPVQTTKVSRIFHPTVTSLTGVKMIAQSFTRSEIKLIQRLKISREHFACLRALVFIDQKRCLKLKKQIPEYSEQIDTLFYYYLRNFYFKQQVYERLKDSVQDMPYLKQIMGDKKKVALIGSTLRNFFLAKFLNLLNFDVTIFCNDDWNENQYYYCPIFMDKSRSQQVLELLYHNEIQMLDYTTLPIVLEKGNTQSTSFDFKQLLQHGYSEFNEMLQNILKGEGSLYDSFMQLLDSKYPRHTLVTEIEQQRRLVLLFYYNKLMFTSTFAGQLTQISDVREHLTKIDQKSIDSHIMGQGCLLLKESLSHFFKQNPFLNKQVKRKKLEQLKQIRLDRGFYYFDQNGKSQAFDFIIFGETSYFIQQIVEDKNEMDNPGFEGQIMQRLNVLKELKMEQFTKFLLYFRTREWKKNQVFCIPIHVNEFLYFFDGNYTEPSFLLVCIWKVSIKQVTGNINEYVQQIKDALKKQFGNGIVLDKYDIVKYEYYVSNQRKLKRYLNPLKNFYLDIPIFNGKAIDPLTLIVETSFKIIKWMIQPEVVVIDTPPTGVIEEQSLKKVKMDSVDRQTANIEKITQFGQQVLQSCPANKIIHQAIQQYEQARLTHLEELPKNYDQKIIAIQQMQQPAIQQIQQSEVKIIQSNQQKTTIPIQNMQEQQKQIIQQTQVQQIDGMSLTIQRTQIPGSKSSTKVIVSETISNEVQKVQSQKQEPSKVAAVVSKSPAVKPVPVSPLLSIYGLDHPFYIASKKLHLELQQPYEYSKDCYFLSFGQDDQIYQALVRLPGHSNHYLFLHFSQYFVMIPPEQDVMLFHENLEELHEYVLKRKSTYVDYYKIEHKFPYVYPTLIQSKIMMKKSFTQVQSLKLNFELQNCRLALREDVGSFIVSLHHPIVRFLLKIKNPQGITLSPTKYKHNFILIQYDKQIKITRMLLSPFKNQVTKFVFEIVNPQIVMKVENQEKSFQTSKELWAYLYSQYCQIYDCKFIYQYINDFIYYEKHNNQIYEKLDHYLKCIATPLQPQPVDFNIKDIAVSQVSNKLFYCYK
ncbi:hypothetical protein pb186bvf_006909 [Paramecium bursaria]